MKKIKIIFVCLGNICRSPAAEGVMKKLVHDKGLDDFIFIDSAGTIPYHAGEDPDPRMKLYAKKRGYALSHVARKFNQKDLTDFDYIIAMDRENYDYIKSLDRTNKFADKIYMMTDVFTSINADEVPYPYEVGPEGFETVLDILEDACAVLLKKLSQKS